MAVTINGSDTAAGDLGVGFTSAEGLILTGQGSSNDVTIKNDADGTVAVIPTGTTNFGFDSGFGSAGVAYGVRAWVNIDGTGTVGINASGNVSSITDAATGIYTVNFASAMPDTNFSVSVLTPVHGYDRTNQTARSTTSCQIGAFAFNGSNTDYDPISVLVVR